MSAADLIDTHCHLTYPELATQIDEVLARARSAGVSRCITVATSPDDARRGAALLARHEQVFLAAGVHPHEAGKVSEDELAALADLHHGRWNLEPPVARRLVAVGETGLDFRYDFAPADVQERVFRAQLALAIEVNRPVIIHARESEERVCEILADYPRLRDRVVFHCYSGGAELARRIFDMGWLVSFTGVVTFRNADTIREALRAAPADRFMVETDSPYLSPEPVRKQRPCEPALVVHTAERIAAERGETLAALAAATTRTAERFFGLKDAEA